MPSVADFLRERLENANVGHIFGVPGDYVLHFVNQVSESKKMRFVNVTDENHAGFAADAYARVHGIGCVCATYNVGALKLCNPVAGAYAEKSPIVVISGSPGMKERNEDFLLHHVVRSFENQRKIFKNITCYSVVLDDPTKAGFLIDEALEYLKYYKQPVYIELPRDIAEKPIRYDVYRQGTPGMGKSDPETLQEALDETLTWLKTAEKPMILAGVQITRFNMEDQLVAFAEKHHIPMATTLLSKSTIDEKHPLFAGVYSGPFTTQDRLREMVDESDCLLIFGEMLTDMTLGFQSPKFTKRQTVSCSVEGLKIKNHNYSHVKFADFCEVLFKSDLSKKWSISLPQKEKVGKFEPQPETKITTRRLFEKVESILDKDSAIVADIGECLFGSSELEVSVRHFLSPAFYCSMGCAIPGALGLQLARPKVRPIVLVGDGAFQMSVSEISTLLDFELNPIIFVLNNQGYTTERFLLDGKFNDLRNWNYHQVTNMMGGGVGVAVETEEELNVAVDAAVLSKDLYVINVVVEKDDISPSLRRIVDSLAKRV
jgi:indolepyruvate decarboxylase